MEILQEAEIRKTKMSNMSSDRITASRKQNDLY
jgi:hypothetical protein